MATVIVDDHEYQDLSKAPDLGSIVCINRKGMKREYRASYKDKNKLIKFVNYSDLETGSLCYFYDRGIWVEWIAHEKKWYKVRTNEIGGDLTLESDESVIVVEGELTFEERDWEEFFSDESHSGDMTMDWDKFFE